MVTSFHRSAARPSRRALVVSGGALLAAVAGGPAGATLTVRKQGGWHPCGKCRSIFFNGYADNKGRCPTGGAHKAAGVGVELPYDRSATDSYQGGWRYCAKCAVLFFDGYPTKGVCAEGGAHAAAGFNFALLHDVAGRNGSYRFCDRCFSMFLISPGYGAAGTCAAGGTHRAQGYIFNLR